MTCVRRDLAFGERLQADEHAPGIDRAVRATRADRGVDDGDGGIGLNDLGDLAPVSDHGVERHVLPGLGVAIIVPVSSFGKKPFGMAM